jgi:lantibiotic leader peptide-processing serine protease
MRYDGRPHSTEIAVLTRRPPLAFLLGALLTGGFTLPGCRADLTSTSDSRSLPAGAVLATRQTAALEAPGEYVVQFAGGGDGLASMVASLGGSVVWAHEGAGVASVTGLTAAQASTLRRQRGIETVTRDTLVRWIPDVALIGSLLEAPSDAVGRSGPGAPSLAPLLGMQWNLRAVHADAAWATGHLGAGARVAIIDSGIDDTHPDLAGRVDRTLSIAFTPNGNPPPAPAWGDDNFHGTHVAGVVASNAYGIASVAPQATLIAVKVLDHDGAGRFADLIAGILYAADVGVDVINLSVGARFPVSSDGGGPLNAAVARAVNYAVANGVLVVAAAGNDGANLDADGDLVEVPAQSGATLAVSATGPLHQADVDQIAWYSNYGRSSIALAAPGGNSPGLNEDRILGACSRQSLVLPVCGTGVFYLSLEGTSQAAPHVAGVAALIDGAAGGGLGAGQLRTRLERAADDLGALGIDPFYGHGRVNALRAVSR